MSEPWLSIIGIGEDGLNGLSPASREALDAAKVVFGGPRHLALAGIDEGRARAWPVPFDTAPVLAFRGQRVAVLTSGDPFWYGAGGSLSRDLAPGEWRCFAAPSTFGLVAAALGWRIEASVCLGLHAAPVATTRPHLQSGARLILLVADPGQAHAVGAYLGALGFGASSLWVAERMGGAEARLRPSTTDALPADMTAPLALAVEVAGTVGMSRASGLPDALFAHDGQITKRPVRALALSALAPRPDEVLWDVGAGSGSISVEWCLAGGVAHAVETRADRVVNIRRNAEDFGLSRRLSVIEAAAPDGLSDLPAPHAVFVGGGATGAVLAAIWAQVAPGCRVVVHAVTLETEALVIEWHARHGGDLMRVEIAHAAPLGRMRGWVPARPVTQWSVVR